MGVGRSAAATPASTSVPWRSGTERVERIDELAAEALASLLPAEPQDPLVLQVERRIQSLKPDQAKREELREALERLQGIRAL
jgi:hypothetical protein